MIQNNSEEQNVELLLSMGFGDTEVVKKALQLAKYSDILQNDVNEAVSYLSGELPGLDNALVQLSADVDMVDASEGPHCSSPVGGRVAASGSEDSAVQDQDTLEFPLTHLYDLESRALGTTWNVPVKRHESLGKCLHAAKKLAERGEMMQDQSCHRFITRCLGECFQKLTDTHDVRRWMSDTQEGIADMLSMLVDLVCAQLRQGEIVHVVMEVFAKCLEPKCEYHQKNRTRPLNRQSAMEQYLLEQPFARVSDQWSHRHEPLTDLINRFGAEGGVSRIEDKIRTEALSVKDLYTLLRPLAACSSLLNPDTCTPLVAPCLQQCFDTIQVIGDAAGADSGAQQDMSCVVDLITVCRTLAHHLKPGCVDQLMTLRLEFILRLLRTAHFASRMQALKEVTRMIDSANVPRSTYLSNDDRDRPSELTEEELTQWLTENNVLALSLEGNLDQGQYCDRLKALLDFLGPRMTTADISKIWQLRRSRGGSLVGDNIYEMMAQAAAKFGSKEVDHFMALLEKHWNDSKNPQERLKLLHLLGRIGVETREQYTYSKMAAALWNFAHYHILSPELVRRALSEQVEIITKTSRESERNDYIMKCMSDIQSGKLILPTLCHLHDIIVNSHSSFGSSTFANTRSNPFSERTKKRLLNELKPEILVKLLCEALTNVHCEAVSKADEAARRRSRTVTLGSTTTGDTAGTATETCKLVLTPASPNKSILKTPQLQPANEGMDELVILHDGFPLRDHIEGIMEFLAFVLHETETLIAFERTREMFEALVADEAACAYERGACFTWLCTSIDFVEPQGRVQLFDRMLEYSPAKLPTKGFECFATYFEEVNIQKSKIVRSSSMFTRSHKNRPLMDPSHLSEHCTVDRLDLHGLAYLWLVALHSPKEDLVSAATRLLVDVSYSSVGAKWKKEPDALHRRFLKDCRERLELGLLLAGGSGDAVARQNAAELLGLEMDGEEVDCLALTRTLDRTLSILQHYITTVERAASLPTSERAQPVHAASHYSPRGLFDITVHYVPSSRETQSRDIVVQTHANAQLYYLREHLNGQTGVDLSESELILELNNVELSKSDDSLLIGALHDPSARWVARQKASASSGKSVSFKPLVKTGPVENLNSKFAFGSTSSKDAASASLELERSLPASLLASDPALFDLLFRLSTLPPLQRSIRCLLHLLPTDAALLDTLDQLLALQGVQPRSKSSSLSSGSGSKSNSLDRRSRTKELFSRLRGGNSGSPKKSISLSDQLSTSLPLSSQCTSLEDQCTSTGLLDVHFSCPSVTKLCSSPCMNAERLMYNLEALSARLLPVLQATDPLVCESASRFCTAFLRAQGYDVLLRLLDKDALPPDTPVETRRGIYLIVVQLLRFLLCNRTPSDSKYSHGSQTQPHDGSSSESDTSDEEPEVTSPDSGHDSLDRPIHPVTLQSDRLSILQAMLQRIAWCSAASSLHLMPTAALVSTRTGRGPAATTRVRGTSWSSSTSSDAELSPAGPPASLHDACTRTPVTTPNSDDDCLATSTLELMVDAALLSGRPALFLGVTHWLEFTLDLLLYTPSESVRRRTAHLLTRIASKSPPSAADMHERIHRVPLPLWPSSSVALRASTHRLLLQCRPYFSFRAALLLNQSDEFLRKLEPPIDAMFTDELNWLLSYDCALPHVDAELICGHLNLMRKLLPLADRLGMGRVKEQAGAKLVDPLVDEFLFPASRLLQRTLRGEHIDPAAVNETMEKCSTPDARVAAYSLLLELCVRCAANLQRLTDRLLQLHHQPVPGLTDEWEYYPQTEPKPKHGYVGLKNAGATCYMNSVVQQFFMQPGLVDTVLAVEFESDGDGTHTQEAKDSSIFFQLQSLFSYLRHSHRCFYEPKQFWSSFRLWGEPVNPREQQDAFEFYINLVDQIDMFLTENEREPIFKRRYEGVFSDQKICVDCPHRYSREESFFALNIAVRPPSLSESLNAFVRGELLEGDNAYYCEKCQCKRTAVKRMCIASLPELLVIQLKRFEYDYEERRAIKFNDYFQFPLSIDLRPYTSDGLSTGSSDGLDSSLVEQLLAAPTSPSSSFGAASPFRKYSDQHLGFSPTSAKLRALDRSPLLPGGATTSDSFYRLAGVVVHSGQASAGHYYSFIRDRNPNSATPDQWFRFNDTTIEPVDFTENYMETELFGGKYTVNSDSAKPNLPTERERYWNAYLLFYERCPGPVSPVRFRPVAMPAQPKSYSINVVPTSPLSLSTSARRDSLAELTHLLDTTTPETLLKPPTLVPRAPPHHVLDDNLRFRRDTYVYCHMYDSLLQRLQSNCVSDEADLSDSEAIALTRLCTFYTLHTRWHVKRSERGEARLAVAVWTKLLKRLPACADWLLEYFATDQSGIDYIDSALLKCPVYDVRNEMARLLSDLLLVHRHNTTTSHPHLNALILHLVDLIPKASQAVDYCSAFFSVLFHYVDIGQRSACAHLLELGGFNALLSFLVKVTPEGKITRQFSASQCREFRYVYITLAALCLSCSLRPSGAKAYPSPAHKGKKLLQPPMEMQELLLNERYMHGVVKEFAWAIAAVPGTQHYLCELSRYLAFDNREYTRYLLAELLNLLNSYASNELQGVFSLAEHLVELEDDLHAQRVDALLDGLPDFQPPTAGILEILERCQNTDSRRTYNCMKLVTRLAKSHHSVFEALTERAGKWQWAVEWLKTRMGGDSVAEDAASGTGTQTDKDSLSNEDSLTRTFQRTVSAQITLHEANQLLADFNASTSTDPDDHNTSLQYTTRSGSPSSDMQLSPTVSHPESSRNTTVANDSVDSRNQSMSMFSLEEEKASDEDGEATTRFL